MWIFNSLIIAIAMYSKIPMPQAEWNEKNMRYAMCFFPVVGVVIGAAEFAAGYALLHWLHCKPLLFSVAMTLIPVLITGGIHLDGFADTVDAMSSYAERERRLEILKDPHTGAFAIIGLCCYFLANVGIWSEIGAVPGEDVRRKESRGDRCGFPGSAWYQRRGRRFPGLPEDHGHPLRGL